MELPTYIGSVLDNPQQSRSIDCHRKRRLDVGNCQAWKHPLTDSWNFLGYHNNKSSLYNIFRHKYLHFRCCWGLGSKYECQIYCLKYISQNVYMNKTVNKTEVMSIHIRYSNQQVGINGKENRNYMRKTFCNMSIQ